MERDSLAIALEASLLRFDVDKSLLPFKECRSLLPNVGANEEEYDLPSRLTTKSLVSKFGKELRMWQNEYNLKIKGTMELLQNNISSAQKMDRFFEDADEHDCSNDDREDDEHQKVVVTKQNKLKIKCPFMKCKVETTKMRRHLINVHKLDKEGIIYANKMGTRITKNCAETGKVSQKATKVQPLNTYTCLVAKRHNYKACPDCDGIYMNLGQHLLETHHYKDDKYRDALTNAVVIPKCYTKTVNGRAVRLAGLELEEAKEIHEEEINKQKKNLQALKNSKEKLINLRKEIKEKGGTASDSQADQLHKEQTIYNNLRYQKPEESKEITQLKESFIKHMERIEYNNPSRAASVALRFLQPYELKKGEPLTAATITPISVREMLQDFKENVVLSVASKGKYIKIFEMFIKYILLDIESPYRKISENIEERTERMSAYKDIKFEFEICYSQLGKQKGAEMVRTKRKAEEKLMTDAEMAVILDQKSKALETIMGNDFKSFDKDQILVIRNDLIVVATIRLGRRSKELTTMSLEEVKSAERIEVNGECSYVIKVLEQKNIKTGQEAPIAYNEKEYQVLKKYIEILRPKLNIDKKCQAVFTTVHKVPNKELSLSGIFSILQLTTTDSGKKLSSRAIRGSIVTNSRYLDLSLQDQEDLASSMSHTLPTARRYYNYKKITDSVAKTLNKSNADISPSMPSPPKTSTPKKRKKDSNDSVINLRCRKIKKT